MNQYRPPLLTPLGNLAELTTPKEATMNRETILSASDEQLNEWAAEKVMGYTLYYEQMDFEPLEDIAQAIALLEMLRDTHKLFSYIYINLDMSYRVRISNWHEQGYCENESLPCAIVIASLLAVAEMEAQP